MTSFLILSFAMVVLLLLKGFFSGSEIALVNSDKIKMRHRAKQGDKGAKMVLRLFQTPDQLLGTTLLGTNISTIALTTFGTTFLIRAFGERGDLLALLVLTPILLIFGEIVPKSVYQQMSDHLAPIIVRPLRFFAYVLYPITFVFTRIARLVTRLVLGQNTEQNLYITREQLHAILEISERGAQASNFDKNRVKRVIRFGETTVAEAMVPLGDMVALERDRPTSDALKLVRSFGFNRIPVYDDNISNIIGNVTLTTWDLMEHDRISAIPLEDLIRPALYVARYQTIDQLLTELQKRQDHMAIVVDEFGSAIGMITLEDIIEEVVGEIDVGYDFEEYLPRPKRHYEQIEPGVYIMESRVAVTDINELLGTEFIHADYHTLSGLILANLKHIPSEGEALELAGWRFEVIEANERAINKVRVYQA